MASKKQTGTTVALVAGAAVVAYIIMSKRRQPTYAYQPAPSSPNVLNFLQSAASAVKNIISPPPSSPSFIEPGIAPVNNIVPSSTVSPAADIVAPLPQTPLDILPTDQAALAGFTNIPGTGLAVLCGLGCAACCPPPKSLGKFEYSDLIIPGALIIGGYFVFKKLGIISNDTTKANSQTSAQLQSALAASIAAAASKGDFQTLTDAQISSLANDIWTNGISSSVNQDQIVTDVIQANTLTDLLKIMQSFMTKPVNTGSWYSWCALFRVNCDVVDMGTFVRAVLDSSHLNTINDYLSAQNINYHF
jgi:hypothetical protein